MQANRVAVAANATLLSMLRLLAAAASARPPWYDGTLSRLNSSTHLGPRETTHPGHSMGASPCAV